MRICPSLEASDSSESQSFLKVDSRKKQLTLYDPASSPHSASGHRRSATVAVPKIFAFDAVFTQDASQVRASRRHYQNLRALYVCLYGHVCVVGEFGFPGAKGCVDAKRVWPRLRGEMCVSGQGPFLPVWAQQLDGLSLLENDMNPVHLYPTSSFTGQLYPTSDLFHTQPTFPVTDKGHIHVYARVNGDQNSFGFLIS